MIAIDKNWWGYMSPCECPLIWLTVIHWGQERKYTGWIPLIANKSTIKARVVCELRESFYVDWYMHTFAPCPFIFLSPLLIRPLCHIHALVYWTRYWLVACRRHVIIWTNAHSFKIYILWIMKAMFVIPLNHWYGYLFYMITYTIVRDWYFSI